MCDKLPDNHLDDPYEALEVAREKGWVPALIVLGQLRLDDKGEPIMDRNHLHFLWGVDVEVALELALKSVVQLHMVIEERDMRRAREN